MPPSPTHPRFRLNSWLRPGFAVSAFVIYAAALPPAAIALAAAIALDLGGLAPGALYAAAPKAAPTAVAPTIGMLQQASNLGQFTGPLALGLWVEHFGWHAAPGIVAPAAMLGISAAFAIRKAMRRPPTPEPLPESVILPLRRQCKHNHGYPRSPIADIWRGHSTPAQQTLISLNRAISGASYYKLRGRGVEYLVC